MKYPRIPYPTPTRQYKQYRFGGYDHRKSCSDGGIYDMLRLCGDDYPIVSTMPKRAWKKIGAPGFTENVTAWTRDFNGGNLYVIKEGDLYRDGTLIKSDFDEAGAGRCMVVFQNALILYGPNFKTKVYDIAEDTVSEIERYVTFGDAEHVSIEVTQDIEYTTVRVQKDGDRKFSDYFKVGDVLKYRLSRIGELTDGSAIIRDISESSTFTVLKFDPEVIEAGEFDQGYFIHECPRIERAVVHKNRIFGYANGEMFASADGDCRNFYKFEGLASDSWSGRTADENDITGVFEYSGYPLFFTETSLCRIYGDGGNEFTVSEMRMPGVMAGCSESLATAQGILYYVSAEGVMRYTGNYPTLISEEWNERPTGVCVAGSDGERYRVTVSRGDEYVTFCYRDGMWHIEDRSLYKTYGYFYIAPYLYKLTECVLEHTEPIVLTEHQTAVIKYGPAEDEDEYEEDSAGWKLAFPDAEAQNEWALTFGDFYGTAAGTVYVPEPNKVSMVKIVIRIELAGYADVSVNYDSEADWTLVKRLTSTAKRTHTLALVPRRCDHFKIRIAGKGTASVYELTREMIVGSTLKSKGGTQ